MGMIEKFQDLLASLTQSNLQQPRAKPQRGTLIHNSSTQGTLAYDNLRSVRRAARRSGAVSARQQRRAMKPLNKVYRSDA